MINSYQKNLIKIVKAHTDLFAGGTHKNREQLCELLSFSHLVPTEEDKAECFRALGFWLSPLLMVVQQTRGKYGSINCLCGHKADYKFSSSSGWCAHCGLMFTYTGGIHIPLTGEKMGPYAIEFEVE